MINLLFTSPGYRGNKYQIHKGGGRQRLCLEVCDIEPMLSVLSYPLCCSQSKEYAAVAATGMYGSTILGISDHLKALGMEANPLG